MRTVIYLLLFCVVSFSTSSQDQFYPATISFYDGAQFTGVARFNKKQEVEFKMTAEDETEILDGFVIKRIVFDVPPYNIFEYIYYKYLIFN